MQKRYKEVKFYELKRLNKLKKRFEAAEDAEGVADADAKIAYVKVP
jgi:hypothetical protein